MMKEIEAERPGAVQLLAINEAGYESSTDLMAGLGDIPLLQDVAEDAVWSSWNATYRDVVIVNGEGMRVSVYNLTSYDLGQEANYAELKARLLAAIDG